MTVQQSARGGERRQQILEVLVLELEEHPGARVTTARLAELLGLSEAALYRHFRSKAQMFEALIAFAEEAVFGLVARILEQPGDAHSQCLRILQAVLSFANRNPGISRVLLGDALVGEHERLRKRVRQFFDRLETQFKQILREGEMPDGPLMPSQISVRANLLLAFAEGRMMRFVRSDFRDSPIASWEEQQALLATALNTRIP